MERDTVRPRKFEREIDHHRGLHEHLELSRITDNWIFYWRFLAHLQNMDYRPAHRRALSREAARLPALAGRAAAAPRGA